MKNRPKARLLRIESMGNELVSLNIMADSVGQEVRSLTDRWATLDEKVEENLLFFSIVCGWGLNLAFHPIWIQTQI